MSLKGKITIYGQTDTGLVRSKNEDTIGFDNALGIVVLADGMGGHRGGDIASSMAVDTIVDSLRQSLPKISKGKVDEPTGFSLESICVQDALIVANDLVFKTGEAIPEHKGMGTTVVVIQFYNNAFSLAHIGDSRCYRFRQDKLEQMTKDHSLLQELIDRGFYTAEEARDSMNKNLVTKALGIEPEVVPDLQEDIALINDIYLLCSDGLTDLVDDEYIDYTIKEFSDNLEEAAKRLITKANQEGGKDNISVMLCRINDDFPTKQSWFNQFVAWFN